MPSSSRAGERTPNAVATIASIAGASRSGLGVTFVSGLLSRVEVERGHNLTVLMPRNYLRLRPVLCRQRNSVVYPRGFGVTRWSWCAPLDDHSFPPALGTALIVAAHCGERPPESSAAVD